MLTLEERIARIEAYLTQQNAAWNVTIVSNGTSGTMTPAEASQVVGYVTPRDEFANVRLSHSLETPVIRRLDSGQSAAVIGQTFVVGPTKSYVWHQLEAGGYMRDDVVTFSTGKPAPIAPTAAPGKWPVPFSGVYTITNRHGVTGHTGIDLATYDRTPSLISHIPGGYVVKAASCNGCGSTPGVRVKSNQFGYGNFVIISYPHPFKAGSIHCLFAHLSAIHTFQGVLLLTGDVIGNVGNVGDSTGNHLHVEMREADTADARWATLQGREIDPMTIYAIQGGM